ncbi:hypothetical protein [Streptomyces roseoviridis]|uniref:Uncharacterized protein n=1 Tax=Streptomyces roseoviridis TaxID=67361 RepID=A0ABV5QMH9_9ACTN
MTDEWNAEPDASDVLGALDAWDEADDLPDVRSRSNTRSWTS